MKMNIKIAALAVAVLGLTTACNQKKEEAVDSMPDTTIEQVIDTIDTVEEVAEPVAEEPVKTAVKKKATKTTPKPELTRATNNQVRQGTSEEQVTGKISKVAARNANIEVSNNKPSQTDNTGKMQKVANRQ